MMFAIPAAAGGKIRVRLGEEGRADRREAKQRKQQNGRQAAQGLAYSRAEDIASAALVSLVSRAPEAVFGIC